MSLWLNVAGGGEMTKPKRNKAYAILCAVFLALGIFCFYKAAKVQLQAEHIIDNLDVYDNPRVMDNVASGKYTECVLYHNLSDMYLFKSFVMMICFLFVRSGSDRRIRRDRQRQRSD